MSNIVSTETRQGVYGSARPAFTVHRFKRTIILCLNEEMAEELNAVLLRNEEQQKTVPPFLFEFTNQLEQALDQPPPVKGEKPDTLAPGRPNPQRKVV